MSNEVKTIKIDDIEYVRADSIKNKAVELEGMKYVIIRTESAGVHAGYLKKRKGNEVELIKARRLYYWEGAFTLSELAMNGVTKPENCKFPCEVDSNTILGVIEVISVTEKARLSIKGVDNYEY